MTTIGHFVSGKRVDGKGERMSQVFNPATGEQIATVQLASKAEVNAIVKVAWEAQSAWGATPPAKRAQVMFRFRDLLNQHIDELAKMLSAEHGKTIPDAKGEIARGIEVVEFVCGIPQLLKGEYSEQVASGVDTFAIRQPVGVVAGITPFNFPAMVPLWMYPVSIACGNTFVLKPSERDPSVPLRIAELFHEAGLPAGVFNVVNGDKEAVDALLDHPLVDAVSFVGSTAIGQYIYSRGTANGKRVQALCGAKNHMVIMPDADMDQAVDALMGAGYGSAGERCMAISVAVPVGAETADRLIAKLTPKVQSLNVAPYTDPNSDMGPVISREALDRIKGYIAEGEAAGAKLVVDGRNLKLQGYEGGYFLGGCLFDNVTTDMSIYKNEIFGPVVSVVRAKGYAEAVDMINSHEYGNGTAIFTRDGDTARDFFSRVKIGMVGVNVPIPVPVAYHSFGGWKRSLFGDHHIHGMEGVRFNTRLKTMTTRWPSGIREGAVFNFHSGSDTKA
ncbi:MULTISPECIES: CoA-acylating methylmalonate-semialdehyde dehydrogenase [unclassified Mesorhizobium]|uniref:CoA-acylating methylmalonate-semialdehyde dehydrogenase n=1 Tax=unclassified Mesorhizobium TaxID=325217 RepID=UPI000FEA204A|nr:MULTISPECIES: CoA-acylating methylmalonate-semialdehyde dehydrogenase [unclassified Mesorhizobium]TGT57294.1 CoA-acylating methylmalonate-semialdehyde dehydrogenase [Mesorhizobium sp. M00.F.Ca.ET.170.01.1.1]RWB66476.1 MAG: CoA-acylating methylmalonate-semialdehyde dehydrogenase [Mesorhizobium sp.]RWB90710.1 MAG: CoA-acylating methylmalonate-semialdehyde dehydrogenase [Mesorhizobium sp.]RWE25919.1 MAG: CoA-acylating methylmalonate-semialdehyde dehydrogenase [Mesorhizobium sp.]RWE37902.1 MAG: